MKAITRIFILFQILLISVSCTGHDSTRTLDIRHVSDVVAGIVEEHPLEKFSLKDADKSVRESFLEELSDRISNDRDASACAMFSRIDKADEVMDSIQNDDYVATLIWHRGGNPDSEELMRKEFHQDPESLSWRIRTMEPFHSPLELRYSVTETAYDIKAFTESEILMNDSGLVLPDFANLKRVCYSYNLAIDRENGKETIYSPTFVFDFLLTSGTEDIASQYVSKVNSLKTEEKIVVRAAVSEDILSVMMMRM